MINSINSSVSNSYGSFVSPLSANASELSTSQSKYINIPKGVGSVTSSHSVSQKNAIDSADKQTAQSKNANESPDAQRDFDTVIRQLKARDLEVKIHEQAHLAAGGQYVTGGASYVYQVGPDGRRYAVGGEVSIDTSPISGDPEASLIKAQQVQAAALAPSEPSSADYKVAQAAASMAAQARSELSSTKNTDAESSSNQDESAKKASESTDQSQDRLNRIPLNETNQTSFNIDRNQFELRMLTG